MSSMEAISVKMKLLLAWMAIYEDALQANRNSGKSSLCISNIGCI